MTIPTAFAITRTTLAQVEGTTAVLQIIAHSPPINLVVLTNVGIHNNVFCAEIVTKSPICNTPKADPETRGSYVCSAVKVANFFELVNSYSPKCR